MPDRRTHIEHASRLIKLLNLPLPVEATHTIEQIIDNPDRIPRNLISQLEACDGRIAMIASLWKLGLRYSQAYRHDWGLNRRKRGASAQLLKDLVSCLYGKDTTLLVDLHSSLDMIQSRNMRPRDYLEWAKNNNIDERVIDYILSHVLTIPNLVKQV